eukprot:m.254289 g.254289  ORF g.254289 m.254289 type:complete len:760 (+) comp33914_c1_seq4:281-2560(+)
MADPDVESQSPGMLALEKRYKPLGYFGAVKQELVTFIEVTGITDIKRVLPITTWITQYNVSKGIGDLIAGLTVGMMLIPQGMAYANIAGLPAVYGLYGAFMGLLVYALTGTSKDVSNGPTALMSLIVAHGLPHLEHPPHDPVTNETMFNPCYDVANLNTSYCCQDGEDFLCTPVNLAIGLSLATGLVQIGMGLLNFGVIIDFIGFPVLNGFTSAAAVTIFSSQVKHIFGLSNIDGTTFITTWEGIFNGLPDTRWQDFIMGVFCMLLTYFLERVKTKYTLTKGDSRKHYFLWLAGTARNAIIVVVGIVIAAIVSESTGDDTQFNLIRDVPSGLPEIVNPFDGLGGDDVSAVWSYSIVTALLGYLESVAIGKAFATKGGYDLDPTQELRAIGLGNVVNSFFQGYPITGSFSRTAVNAASGSQTPLSGLVTALIVIIALVALTEVFYFIPKAALAAMIIMSVVHMVDIAALRRIAKVSKADLFIWLWVFLCCVFWNLEYGIGTGVGWSIIFSSWKARTQRLERLERDDMFGQWLPEPKYHTRGLENVWGPNFVMDANSPPNIIVIKITGSIEFAMASTLRDRMQTITKYFRDDKVNKSIIIDMSAVSHIDYTGVMAFEDILEDMKPAVRNCIEGKHQVKRNCLGVSLHLATLQPSMLVALKNCMRLGHHVPGTNIQKGLWRLNVHRTIDLAIQATHQRDLDIVEYFPFPWLTPDDKPHELETSDIRVGQDDKDWIVKETDHNKKYWARTITDKKSAYQITKI